jgi:hypothetical protein
MNKPKKQGTEWESEIVRRAKEAGFDARRLAEGGSTDEGDVELVSGGGGRMVVEAKHRSNLNVHKELLKAEGKTKYPTVIFWKRLGRKDGNTRRTADGPPVVVMSMETFFDLYEGY